MKIGILGLQGAVDPHREKLKALGVESIVVKTAEELLRADALILPGGESTTMLHLLFHNRLFEPVADFIAKKPTWGVCAGSILLAKIVEHPKQESFGLLDITAERNAFGRQIDSFIDDVELGEGFSVRKTEAVFIRAPRFSKMGSSVKVLATWRDEPVMVREKHIVASSFHPELSFGTILHDYFITLVKQHG